MGSTKAYLFTLKIIAIEQKNKTFVRFSDYYLIIIL